MSESKKILYYLLKRGFLDIRTASFYKKYPLSIFCILLSDLSLSLGEFNNDKEFDIILNSLKKRVKLEGVTIWYENAISDYYNNCQRSDK